jgi:competence protein ComEC
LILAAMSVGREPLSLRLLAAGATFVLLFWPEALAGPSFQLSFAAVGTIILLHENRRLQNWMRPQGGHMVTRILRGIGMLLATGLAIELVLAPIALYHFHKSGLYGALANMVAIPLTTFVIMPTQLLGLCADAIIDGLGAPFWWLASNGIAGILWLAREVSAAPGAVVLLPEMPGWAFAITILSAILIAIFTHRRRWILLLPLLVALWAMLASPQPDMLVTGDGQHLAVLGSDSKLALLRPGAGDYTRSILGETAAVAGTAQALDVFPGAKCNSDGCSFKLDRGGREWRVLALRSNYLVPAMELAAACARSDIVISQRRLPWSCKPAWLKADAALLEKSGGLAFHLREPRITTVAETNAHHPWSVYAPERLAQKATERQKAKAAKFPAPPNPDIAATRQ